MVSGLPVEDDAEAPDAMMMAVRLVGGGCDAATGQLTKPQQATLLSYNVLMVEVRMCVFGDVCVWGGGSAHITRQIATLCS
jgi:hypothetical protein